jgi:hypothetical protein
MAAQSFCDEAKVGNRPLVNSIKFDHPKGFLASGNEIPFLFHDRRQRAVRSA